jgi:lipid A oxidase
LNICLRAAALETRIVGAIGGLLLLLSPARAEWTVTAYLGNARTAPASLRVKAPQLATNLLLQPISYQTKPFQSPLYYGYRAGYFFTPHFGLEGEFTHLKVYAETGRTAQITGTLGGSVIAESAPIDSIVQRFNITHGVNLVLANFVARKGFRKKGPSPRFLLSGRLGFGMTVLHAENEILGVSNPEHYQIGRPAWQVGAGLEIRLWRSLYADIEVKYTRTRQNVDIAQGTAESLLRSTHGIAGFVWHF